MTAPVTLDSPLTADLTARWFRSQGFQPCIAGDDWTLRLQLKWPASHATMAGQAIDLSGATVKVTVLIKDGDDAEALTRTSGVNIAGTDPAVAELAIDADQTAEDTGANTGRGWVEIRTRHEEEAVIDAAAGRRPIRVKVTFGDGSVTTPVRGTFEILPQ
jgi:hypothetical protein